MARAVRRGQAARVAVVAPLTAVLLASTGCGGGGGSTAASPSASVPAPTATAPTRAGSATTAPIRVTSTAFADGSAIPAVYTCHGRNLPPPLAWTGAPSNAAALALLLDDPDAVGGRYIHWVVTDIPVTVTSSAEGQPPAGGVVSTNSSGQPSYLGPCPPAGTGVHHYRFTVYALSRKLGLAPGTNATGAAAAIDAAASAQGRLVGTYKG